MSQNRLNEICAASDGKNALVEHLARLTLFEESGQEAAEDSPANYEWLIGNHEALEALISQARELCGK